MSREGFCRQARCIAFATIALPTTNTTKDANTNSNDDDNNNYDNNNMML